MRRALRRLRLAARAAAYRAAKAVFARRGYDFQVFLRSARDAGALDDAATAAFYTPWAASSPVYAPWLGDPDFRAAYDGVEPYTVVSSDRCYVLHALARQAARLPGDFAECGVYQGGTALLLARAAAPYGKRLRLFDSFEGLPAPDPERDPDLAAGVFRATSAEAVAALLAEHRERVEIRPGWIPSTFAGLEAERFAFVHVDVDLYRSTLDCLDFFYPRLVAGAIVVFDDYGFPAARGEKAAVDEFFAERPEVPLVLPTGQALVIKLDPETAR